MMPIVPRLKLAVAEYGTVLVVMFAVIGVVALGSAGWLFLNPPTETVTEPSSQHRVAMSVDTQALVTGQTSLWEQGTLLENRPVYPVGAAPNVTLIAHAQVPSEQSVEVDQELTLVYVAKKDEVTFWEREQPLGTASSRVTDGEAVTTTTLQVSDLRQDIERYNRDISGLGRVVAMIRYNVSYSTAAFSGSISKTVPMEITASGYWLEGSFDTEKIHEGSIERQVAGEPNMEAIGLLLVVGLSSLLGAGGIAYLRRRHIDAAAARHELEHHRCSEWISEGELQQAISGQDIAMRSLEDLVNVAIDSKNRVVFDSSRDLYAVVNRGMIYYFDPRREETGAGVNLVDTPEVNAPITEPPAQEIETDRDAWGEFVEEVSDE